MSTTHVILDVLTISYDHINDNNFTSTVPLNFQKAFDTVCHTLILSQVKHYDNREVAHKFISFFLSGRQKHLAQTKISCPSRSAIRNNQQSIWSAFRNVT